jgi:hypothetical protein
MSGLFGNDPAAAAMCEVFLFMLAGATVGLAHP